MSWISHCCRKKPSCCVSVNWVLHILMHIFWDDMNAGCEDNLAGLLNGMVLIVQLYSTFSELYLCRSSTSVPCLIHLCCDSKNLWFFMRSNNLGVKKTRKMKAAKNFLIFITCDLKLLKDDISSLIKC